MKIFSFLKKNLISFVFVIFAVFLVLFSNSNLNAARSGLKLWANNVVPALFPFFVATELLSHTNVVYYLSKHLDKYMRPIFNVPGVATFPFIMGLISGYPVGAKIVSDLYSKGACSKEEAERMVAFTNNSGPLFIIGTVGSAFYSNSLIGIILLITHILSSISMGLILGYISKRKRSVNFITKNKRHSDNSIALVGNKKFNMYSSSYEILPQKDISIRELGSILGSSVLSAIKTVLTIGGFVTIFSVIISILKKSGILLFISEIIAKIFNIDSDMVLGTITGIIEFTNGLSVISNIHLKNISINLIVSAFIIGFGGISVTLQVLSIISENKIGIRTYFFSKIAQGLIASLYTFLILLITIFNLNL